jgi:surfeit locus 1 family protein
MMRRMIVPLLFGLLGAAVLIGLGLWQLQRLDWKQGVLAAIDARLADAPVTLPEWPNRDRDAYLAVTVEGRFTGESVDVLASLKQVGAVFRVVEVFETRTGRRILVDRGYVTDDRRPEARTAAEAEVSGNLHWPEEVDRFTPPPDPATGIWFARDLDAMADALATERVLVVARSYTGDGIEPLPVDSATVPNNHLQYAITWFSLAVVWLGMTVLLLWRIRRRTV